ncbi:coproporphyrinogen III oxidase, partial [Pseudomonas syringae pv. tagetis]
MTEDGLFTLSNTGLKITPAGRLLVRAVCMVFAAYLPRQSRQQFSRVI